MKFFRFSRVFAGLFRLFAVYFAYNKERRKPMKKQQYLNKIREAKTKDELMGVIIEFSQDETLPWATFMELHDKAEIKLIKFRRK